MSGDKEEEIAKLEEQLRKLRAEAAEEGEQITANGTAPAVEAEEVVPEAMFLSEGWKEVEEESSEGGGSLKTILGGIGLAIFLAIFSQIPVGQEDYTKYSAVRANTEKIDLGDINRARQASDL